MTTVDAAVELGHLALKAGARYWLAIDGHKRDACFEYVSSSRHGPAGWLPGEGGLIANLRVWENCLLPLSYYGKPPDLQDEVRFGQLLDQLGVPEEEQPGFAGSPASSLTGRQRRLACALRTLMTRPSLILAEGEWLARLDQDDTQRLIKAFAAECPDAAWLVLGGSQPAAEWGCIDAHTGTTDGLATR